MTSLLIDGLSHPQKREDEEQWRSIPGYEGLYEASNTGLIRTAYGKTTSSAKFPKRVWKQRVLKQKVEKRRFGGADCRVNLWKNGKEKTCLVSRLVAMAWCDGYKDGYTVNHIDGNPMNNNARNLEWVDIGDNIRHAFVTGLIKTARPCTLITEDWRVLHFQSLSKAADYLHCYIDKVSKHGKAHEVIKGSDGAVYNVIVWSKP